MLASFKKIFCPTKEDQIEHLKFLKRIHDRIPQRVNLVPDDEESILLVSEPFQGFLEDCERCKSYIDDTHGISESGYCNKHNIACGWGFTCADWESAYNFDEWYANEMKKLSQQEPG